MSDEHDYISEEEVVYYGACSEKELYGTSRNKVFQEEIVGEIITPKEVKDYNRCDVRKLLSLKLPKPIIKVKSNINSIRDLTRQLNEARSGIIIYFHNYYIYIFKIIQIEM